MEKYFNKLDVFDIPISGVCVKVNEFPPINFDCNRNRYEFYMAERLIWKLFNAVLC